jgi:HEAT repeat protein
MNALPKLGPEARQAVPILLRILETEGPEMMHYAALGLAQLEADDARIGPALLKALSHDDLGVNCSAAAALASLKLESSTAVRAIVKMLQSKSFTTKTELQARRTFVRHLAEFGPMAEPAIPCLLELCRSQQGDLDLQLEVMNALVRIGPAAHKAIPGLKELGDRPSFSRFQDLIQKLDKK